METSIEYARQKCERATRRTNSKSLQKRKHGLHKKATELKDINEAAKELESSMCLSTSEASVQPQDKPQVY